MPLRGGGRSRTGRDRGGSAVRAQLVDLRTTLELAGPIDLAPSGRVRRAAAADAPVLEGMARELAAFSRFAADPRIQKAKVEEMYEIWVRRCLDEGVVTDRNR